MPTRNTKKINLIPQDEFEKSSLGRILKWALSTFRVMVIVTELVVMSAFLSRFWLDTKNSDLNEKISNSKSQIIAYRDVETEFRSIQKRINIAKSIYLGPKVSSFITNVSSMVPQNITLISFSEIEGQITIKASTSSEKSIAQFLVNLEENKNLIDINLSQISSNVDNNELTLFTILAKVKS